MKLLLLILFALSSSVIAQEVQCYAKEDRFWSFKTYDTCNLCFEEHEKCIEVCEKRVWECTSIALEYDGNTYAYIMEGNTEPEARENALRECRLWHTFATCYIDRCDPIWKRDSVTQCEKEK